MKTKNLSKQKRNFTALIRSEKFIKLNEKQDFILKVKVISNGLLKI